MVCTPIHRHNLWHLLCANTALLPTLDPNVKIFSFKWVVYWCSSLETRDGKPEGENYVFIWKAIAEWMLLWQGGGVGVKASREEGEGNMIKCGRMEGHLCRRGRVVCRQKGGSWTCENRNWGEREEGRRDLFFTSVRLKRSCYRAGQYVSPQPPCVLHFNYRGDTCCTQGHRYRDGQTYCTCTHEQMKHNHGNWAAVSLRTTTGEFILRCIICFLCVPSLWARCVTVRLTKPTCISVSPASASAVVSDKPLSYLDGKNKERQHNKGCGSLIFILCVSFFASRYFFL